MAEIVRAHLELPGRAVRSDAKLARIFVFTRLPQGGNRCAISYAMAVPAITRWTVYLLCSRGSREPFGSVDDSRTLFRLRIDSHLESAESFSSIPNWTLCGLPPSFCILDSAPFIPTVPPLSDTAGGGWTSPVTVAQKRTCRGVSTCSVRSVRRHIASTLLLIASARLRSVSSCQVGYPFACI